MEALRAAWSRGWGARGGLEEGCSGWRHSGPFCLEEGARGRVLGVGALSAAWSRGGG